MKDAAAQLERILTLIPRIADGDEHSLDEIAGILGVEKSTVLADLESLAQRFDEPGGFVEGLQVFVDATNVSVRTDHFLRPMRLTIPEVHALDLGLSMLLAERPSETKPITEARERIRALTAKLQRVELGDGDRAAALSTPGMNESLGAIRSGLSARTKLRIEYRRADAVEATPRTICPSQLVFASGMWYLIAHCERSDALRIFRVDRMEHVEVLSDTCTPPDEAATARLLESGRALLADPEAKLRVRYSAKIARWIQEREQGVSEPDGSFVVEHPLADVDWAVRHVLQYGAEAEVLGPESARAAVRARLERMLRGESSSG
jgi:proteasome accessory factor C